MIVSSPILTTDASHGEGAISSIPGARNDDFEFGVDPSLDPELAMVGAW